MDFEEWTIRYVKHRDLFFKKLEGFEKFENKIVFRFKDKTVHYFLQEFLDNELLEKLSKEKNKVVVCGYKKQNMDFVAKNWPRLSSQENFLIIFADPKTGKKLVLNPKSHNSIADPASLEMGLMSMFESNKES